MSKKNKSRKNKSNTDYLGKSKFRNNPQVNDGINNEDDCKNCGDGCMDYK